MHPKKSKSEADSKNSAPKVPVVEEQTEPIPEPKNININIHLEKYINIKPFYPVADIQTNITYGDTVIGVSPPIPIIDDEVIPVDQHFMFTIDSNNPKELDALISSPATFTVEQIQGTMDRSVYPQLKLNSQLNVIPKTRSFESIISMYEAMTTKKMEIVTPIRTSDKRSKRKKGVNSTSKVSIRSSRSEKTSMSTKTSDEYLVRYPPSPFGMCCLDFLPLFYGQTKFTQALLIKPTVQYTDNRMLSYKAHPKVIVTVNVEESLNLLTPTFLNFTLETIYNIPLVMSEDMDYWACVMLPMYTGKKTPLLFTNPTMVSTTQVGISKLWPGTHRVYGDANTTSYGTPLDFKDIICNFDPGFEKYITEESPRLEFVMIKRNLMLKDATSELINHIRVYRKIVIEFYVLVKEKTRKTSLRIAGKVLDFNRKSGKGGQFLHLMAILDVAELLYPGVTKIRLAAPLTTFSADEAAKYGGLEDSFFVPSLKKEVKEKELKDKEVRDTNKKDNKSVKSSKASKTKGVTDRNLAQALPSKPVPNPEPEPSVQVFNEDGKPCFVVLAIELSNALKPARKIEDLREELGLLLKEKKDSQAMDQKIILTSCMASDYFKEVLDTMIIDLNKKFLVFTEENPIPANKKETGHETAVRFVNFLKHEGIYESYVAAITKATAMLVSKKFEPVDQNSKEFQNIVGKIFVHLISKMNTVVNKLMCHNLEPLTTRKKTNKFFLYAKEAMDTERPEMAERYFLERICSEANEADCWFDYGIYLLESRDENKAYECIKEALLHQQQHRYCLLVLGALLSNKGQKEDAETCFLNLVVEDSTWSEGWAILYLFYQKTENYEGMNKTIGKVNKCGDLLPPSDYFSNFDEFVWTSKICPQTVFFRAAILLLKLRLYEWSELALAQEIIPNPGIVHYLLSAICYYKKLYRHGLDHITESLKYYGPDYAITSLKGHCLMALNRKVEAEEQYYYALESYDRPVHLHLASINLAKILAARGKDQEARKLILLACKYNPTPYTWFLAGTYYYQENDLLSAEECFSEGNCMDNRYAEIWGYLALVNFKLNRQNEAELCFDQAKKNNLSDEELLHLLRIERKNLTHMDF